MHELYISEAIISSVIKALPPGIPLQTVKEVQIQVGSLEAVVPETLLFSFNAIKASHGMSQAELHIENIAVRCRCQDCGREFGLDLPVFICPKCGGGCVEVISGRGITLMKITADDPEGVEDGNPCHP